jgi:phosphate transport system substrate-binding protein
VKVTPSQAITGHRTTRRSVALIGLAAGSALALSACGSSNNSTAVASSSSPTVSCVTGNASGGGSTFQQNIENQWISDYQKACTGSTLAYAGTGSGAGKTSFGGGTVDWAGTDSNMNATEQAAADARCGATSKAIQTPITAGAVIVTYNLTGVSSLQLSAATLAGIFQGTITKWDDAAIKADNPGASLPSTTIVPVHRSDKSGTTNIFSSFLKADAPSAWTLGAAETLTWPGGQSGSGSDGTTTAVKQTPGGITYTELSFAKLNNLPVAKLKNASGAFVDATTASVSAGLKDATVDTSHSDIRVMTNYATTNPAAYPASAVTYVITCTTGNKNVTLLKSYFTYALTIGTGVDEKLGYAPLPDVIATPAKTQIASIS